MPRPKNTTGCSVQGCIEQHSANGYCKVHAQRVRKYGHPIVDKPIRKVGEPMAFLKAVLASETDECILWPFATNDIGYPQIGAGGKVVYAHREVCAARHGLPPSPLHEAAHSCGNGDLGCINHRHLRWATHQENQMDRVGHGTSNRGERNGQVKLTLDQVRSLRRMLGTRPQPEIAEHFGISQPTVSLIATRKLWGWLDA